VVSIVLVLVVEVLESVLDLRRRNGRDGTRYDGKIDGSMSRYFHNRKSLGIACFGKCKMVCLRGFDIQQSKVRIDTELDRKKPELDRQSLRSFTTSSGI
jgi:hypothetical protein